jgi:hypothetical protein
MAGLLYFLPGAALSKIRRGDDLVLAALESPALADILADVRGAEDCAFSEIQGVGPGKQSGVLIVPFDGQGQPPADIGYYPARQAWSLSACELYWVGIAEQSPPKPADLARRNQIEGYEVELHRQFWNVPIVRRWPNATALPRQIEFDAAGGLISKLSEKHQRLFDGLGRYCESIFGNREPSDDDEREWFTLALDCLAVNYRIGQSTQNLLHMLDSDNYNDVLAKAADVPFFEQTLQKKSASVPA